MSYGSLLHLRILLDLRGQRYEFQLLISQCIYELRQSDQ